MSQNEGNGSLPVTSVQSQWKYTEALPDKSDIVIFISGLFGICSDKDGKCQIGYLIRGNHTPTLIWEDPSGFQRVFDLRALKNEACSLIMPTGNVQYFSFEQNTDDIGARDDFDFNWILDFERLFPTTVRLKQGECRPFFTINSGVFCAIKTSSKFTVIKNSAPRFHSSVALIVAGAITLDRNDEAVLTVSGEVKHLAKGNKPHVLYFLNLCDNTSTPTSSDIGEYAHTFDDNTAPPNFDVKLFKPGSKPPSFPDSFPLFSRVDSAEAVLSRAVGKHLESSDRVPCGVAGYGAGGCF